MKATGIVRRIDDLGRVVIPKEIRRTLQIRESDPLEIFTDQDGGIVLKKFSPIGELSHHAKHYTDSLAQVTGNVVAIADREKIIAVSGGLRTLMDRRLSREVVERLDNRETWQAGRDERNFARIVTDYAETYVWETVVPILCEGDVVGAVIMLATYIRSRMGEQELKLAQTAAGFFGRQMEQ